MVELNVIPLQGKVIIEIDKPPTERIHNGIVIPVNNQEPPNTATIMAVPKGRYENGVLLPCEVKVGDRVVFQPLTQVTVKLDGKEYWAISEGNIICILNDERKN